MKNVTFTFVGQDSKKMAEQFYYWFIDGGLEDQIVETLSEMGPCKVEVLEFDNDNMDIVVGCRRKNRRGRIIKK